MSAYLLGEIADELDNAGMSGYADSLREWDARFDAQYKEVYEALLDHGGRTNEGNAADVRLVVAELAADRSITLDSDELDALRWGRGSVNRDGVAVYYD